MEIKHFKHSEIDRQKWDACIQNACNPLVYAESWFLDIVSPNWEALVLDDYEYVMPLPVKRKYGLSFLVQPPLTQQLGVFSAHTIEECIVESFIQKLPYCSYHLDFNEQNSLRKGIKQHNFILNLKEDYSTIFSKYSTNTKRNVKKTEFYSFEIKTDVSANDFLEFYHNTEKNYAVAPDAKVNQLIRESIQKNRITIYGAYNSEHLLIAALCLLHSFNRLIYWLPMSNKEGKETSAMFKIVDTIIQKNANSNLMLDFYGSNVQSIARFYEGFGAKLTYYYEIKRLSINDFIKRLCFWK